MPTDDRIDMVASLRRMVEEEGDRQRGHREATARAERERRAATASEATHEASVRAGAERKSGQLIVLFLDARRRAGDPGLEELRMLGPSKRKWWKGSNEVYRVPGPPVRGWVLSEAWWNGETKPDYRETRPGAFLSASGDVYALGLERDVSVPREDGRLIDERHLAQCLARHGVAP